MSRLARLCCLFFLSGILSAMAATTCHAAPQHAFALYDQPKYAPDFDHFDYVNVAAPKGGKVVLAAVGTFDTLNPFILKGTAAEGTGLLFDTLMTGSGDEQGVSYGLLAESIDVADDKTSVTFTLRDIARFHDGTPVTAEDVAFTFDTLKKDGHPAYRTYYQDIVAAQVIDSRRVRFMFRNAQNRELPLIIGEMPVISKTYYTTVAFNKTTLVPPMGSGPYRVKAVEPGRSITYERDPTYWANNIPVRRGHYNFAQIRYDYYRDQSVLLEAFKGGAYDFRKESIAKQWATGYQFPATKDGRVVVETLPDNSPAGMQAYIFNTRRAVFRDPRVREAIGYAFDFEWMRKNVFNGEYVRSKSYFENSDLAARGLPQGRERAILEEYRGRISSRAFTHEFVPPTTDGSGNIRANLKKARDLLIAAGWTWRDGKLVHGTTGAPLRFEIMMDNPAFERVTLPMIRNLKRLGIEVSLRMIDATQYSKRAESFDFDMTVFVIPQSGLPGNEQRDYWTTAAADRTGSRNWAGIKDPVVDALVEQLIAAPTYAELVATTRALDRVLLWNFYAIPNWYNNTHRLAYWNKFSRPDRLPKYDLGFLNTWWVDAKKQAVLQQRQNNKDKKDPRAEERKK